MKKTVPGLTRTITTAAALGISAFAHADSVTHYYTVSVDYSLSRLWVEARFKNPVSQVSARSRSASRYLLDVRGCDESDEIRMRGRRMLLPSGGIRCLNYTVDLGRAASAYRNNRHLADNNIVASPSYWLWRPGLSDGTKIHVDFRLPEGMQVSVPWQQVDDNGTRFLLGKSPESASAPAAFGRFDYRELDVPGAILRVTMLDGKREMNYEAVSNWLRATATDISLAYGQFPNPSPQVVVVPVSSSRSSSPVPFGRVIRDGGETVELFVNPDQPLERFLEDWTATHEFSHLMHPYLKSDHHWITEGFAQYYQNVLLARAGAYEPEESWQKLYAGYERGRKSRPELSPNDAASGSSRRGRMKVYWSGAALALMADVTLRERSGGEETLDTVMARFRACCLPSDRIWTGQEFFTRLDDLAGEPVFMPLYRRYADVPGFPDTGLVFERLGLSVSNGRVNIQQNGELADIRDAITRTDKPTAQWRGQLSSN